MIASDVQRGQDLSPPCNSSPGTPGPAVATGVAVVPARDGGSSARPWSSRLQRMGQEIQGAVAALTQASLWSLRMPTLPRDLAASRARAELERVSKRCLDLAGRVRDGGPNGPGLRMGPWLARTVDAALAGTGDVGLAVRRAGRHGLYVALVALNRAADGVSFWVSGAARVVWVRERHLVRAYRRARRARRLRAGALTPFALSTALNHHEVWVGSGWEMGKRADFHRLDLHGVDVHGAFLPDADFHGADLHNVDLHDADLEGADLHQANLRRANLRRAELRWADLHQADLYKADLSGANLAEADLQRANLRRADVSGADLTDADLRGADLTGIRGLSAAQLATATVDGKTRLPKGMGE